MKPLPARPGPRAAALAIDGAPGTAAAGTRPFALLSLVAGVAFAVVTLGMILGPHRIGDYMTETDFYGAYAQGARLIEHGTLDPARYGVIGPGYEVALAVAGWLVHDLFVAAELLSLLSALVVLGAWHLVMRRRVSAGAAFFTTLFIAANGHFLRHGYSATTDAFAIALQALAFAFLLGRPRAPEAGRDDLAGAFAAGACVALAFLTRYSAIGLLPAGVAAILAGGTGAARRTRAATTFAAGFLAPVLPWMLFSLAHGGTFALQLHHNIAYEVFARSRGIAWDDYQKTMQPQFHNLWDVIARDPGAVFGRMLFNVGDHLRLDALSLLTWPVALAAALGVYTGQRDGTLRRLWPVWLAGALLFLALVPVFYSERYSLALLPVYAALAGSFFASPILALAFGRDRVWLKPYLAAIPLGVALGASHTVQARVIDQLPTEVLAAADTLRRLARPGDRVIARKGHIAYHGGVEPLGFPFADSLEQLAAYAHTNRARWIYFSWPEAETRPRLWFLLDTAAVVPGLTARAVTHPHPAVLYEVGDAFGTRPAWMANDTLLLYHTLRAHLMVDGGNPTMLYNAALVDRTLGHLDEALKPLGVLLNMKPRDPRALLLMGDILLAQERARDARQVFEHLLAIDPGNVMGGVGRGWALLMEDRPQDAARAWQPLIEIVRDRATLGRMAELYASLGDETSAARARARLAAAGNP